MLCAALLLGGMHGLVWSDASDTTPTAQVDSFRISGNTLLERAAIEAALEPYQGSRNLLELKAAAAALEALYIKAGYGGVIVYVPPQQSASGVLDITVLEGRISRIVVLDNRRDSEGLVLRSVPGLRVGVTPRPRRIDEQIELTNQNPARQLAVTLEPGAKRGQIEARVSVTELPERIWSVGLDNTGNKQTGRLRTNLGFLQSNLFGLDQTFQIGAQLAPEDIDSVTTVSAAWRAPIYSAGLMLDLQGGYSDVDGGTTSTAAGPLQFSGKGHTVGGRLTKALPRLGAFSQRLSVGLDYRDYLNDCSIGGLPEGACGSAGASVSVSPASLDYQLQLGGRNPAVVQLGYFANTNLFGGHADRADFEAARAGAKRSFRGERLNAQALLALPGDTQLQVRAAGQATRSALVPGEQFGLAGINAVRGYQEREVTGDQAMLLSIEFRSFDMAALSDTWIDHLRWITFVDGGRVWNHEGLFCRGTRSNCTLGSAGTGFRMSLGGFQANVVLASAFKRGNLTDRYDQFLHLQASYEFR